MTRRGAELLKEWRGKLKERSQGWVAAKLGSHQSTVARWEREDDGASSPKHRPSLADAVRLQQMSEGDVPATSWGYSESEVNALLQAALTLAQGIIGAATEAPEVAS